jgi:protein tyrosine phosphatase
MKKIYIYLIFFLSIIYIFSSKKTIKIAKAGYKLINKSIGSNNADEIINNLWLGNLISSTDRKFILNNNIKTIINVSKDLPFIDINDIVKYRIPVHDNYSLKTGLIIKKHLNNILDLIYNTIKNNNGVLVHCKAGSQRSATVIAIYLIYKLNMNKNDCYKLIKMKRNIAFFPVPNYDKVL